MNLEHISNLNAWVEFTNKDDGATLSSAMNACSGVKNSDDYLATNIQPPKMAESAVFAKRRNGSYELCFLFNGREIHYGNAIRRDQEWRRLGLRGGSDRDDTQYQSELDDAKNLYDSCVINADAEHDTQIRQINDNLQAAINQSVVEYNRACEEAERKARDDRGIEDITHRDANDAIGNNAQMQRNRNGKIPDDVAQRSYAEVEQERGRYNTALNYINTELQNSLQTERREHDQRIKHAENSARQETETENTRYAKVITALEALYNQRVQSLTAQYRK